MSQFEIAHPAGKHLFNSILDRLQRSGCRISHKHAANVSSISWAGRINIAYVYTPKTQPVLRAYFLSFELDDLSIWSPLSVTLAKRKGSFGELYPFYAQIKTDEDVQLFTAMLREYCIPLATSHSRDGNRPVGTRQIQEFVEGIRTTVLVNRIERSGEARKACIDHHGSNCAVCGFSFEHRYGELGKGFIEVHHLQQLSFQVGKNSIDPVSDLLPVCSKCHSMMHRRTPPLTIAEIRSYMSCEQTDERGVSH
jgi:hypothetical protein